MRIQELDTYAPDPIDIYKARYRGPVNDAYIDKIDRHTDIVFNKLPMGSSLLNLGAGHPRYSSTVWRGNSKITKMGVLDYVEEASIGLPDQIEFFKRNVITDEIPAGYDYIFSSHLFEHLTRDQIMENVLPKCRKQAQKETIIIVPYRDAWKDEKSHKCRFTENDELAEQAYKHEIVHEELILWIK